MIQPEAAASVLGDPVLRDQGLLSRLLIAAPQSLAGNRFWKNPAEEVEPALRRYIARILLIFETPTLASNSTGNELAPRTLELSPQARELWVEFHDAVEMSMRPDGPLAALRDVAGKAAEHAGRIAGVLQIVDDEGASVIETDAMARACELADWDLREAARLANEMAIPPAVRDAQTLLAWLRARGLETVTATFFKSRVRGPCVPRRGLTLPSRHLKRTGGLFRISRRVALGELRGRRHERLCFRCAGRTSRDRDPTGSKEGATVSAVLAADEGAASQEPQKPQKPRAGRRVFIGSTWTRRPQEPQEPQINPTTIYGSINIESKIIENEDRSATSVEPAVLAVLAVLAVDEESTTQELAAASVGTAGVEAGAPVPAETVSAGPLVLTALPDETSLAGSQDTKIRPPARRTPRSRNVDQ